MGHELLSYCRQIAEGLEYLSRKLFVHKDLAARNILLSNDYVCKVHMICIVLLVLIHHCLYIIDSGY